MISLAGFTPEELGLPADRFPEFREIQVEAIEQIANGEKRFQALCLPTGCHARGQGILMSSGIIKKVQDIEVGDELMGWDSEPRTVLRLRRGNGMLHRVIPVKGNTFVVNDEHVLTLYRARQ